MPATSERLPQEPIIVITVREPFNPQKDLGPAEQEFATTAATIDGPVYRIVDLSRWNVQFSDLVHIMDNVMRKNRGADPRFRTILVSSSQIAALGAKAAGQAQYMGVETPLFGSLDDALVYVRAELARK